MKLSKAIEILELENRLTSPNLEPDLITANKLGIEALKFYQDSSHYACDHLLPGQTKETPENEK